MRYSLRRGGSAASRSVLAAVCAAATTTAITAVPVRAQTSAAMPSNLVTLDVREARLENAVQLLTSQTGINNVVFVNVPGKTFGVVTVKMEDQPFEKALRAMATSAMAKVTLEDGIYYLSPRGADDEAKPVTSVPPAQPVVVETPKKRKAQWVQIPLQYMIPSTFKKLCDFGSLFEADPSLPNFDDIIYRKPIMGPTPQSQVQQAPGPNSINNPAAQQLQQPGGAGLTAGRDGGDAFAAGQRGGFGPGGFGGGAGGGQGGFGGGQGGGRGGGGQGAGGQNGGFLPDGVDRVIAYDAGNTLLVQGDPEGIEELRALIRYLDVAPKQVIIKAEFVQLSVDDADQFGIDWQFKFANNIGTNIPSQGGTTPTFTMAYASGAAVANLRASLIRNTTNLLQSPIITTTNNTPATIAFAESTPTFITTQTVTNVGITQTTSSVNIVATNGLTVVPHINGDNSISLGLQPQLQRNSVVLSPDGTNAGVDTVTQALSTYRRIANGETMVLGGFITRQEQRQESKVPILADLPIIGSLFTQKTRTVTGQEVLVFVTPTIIEDHSSNATSIGGPTP